MPLASVCILTNLGASAYSFGGAVNLTLPFPNTAWAKVFSYTLGLTLAALQCCRLRLATAFAKENYVGRLRQNKQVQKQTLILYVI